MSNMMRIDESLALLAESAQKSAVAAERRAAAEERRAAAEERNTIALERYAAAAERAALVAEENLRDGRASRVELHAFFEKLSSELLPVALAKVEGALGITAEQAEEEEESDEEEDEGQRPVPVAVEAPVEPTPEPIPAAEPAPAPVEAKQEEQEKPAAAAEPVETASEDKAELAEELPPLDAAGYLRTMQELNKTYPLSADLRKHIQNGIRAELGIKALVECEPKMRRLVVSKYEAALKRIEKEGLTAEAPSETA